MNSNQLLKLGGVFVVLLLLVLVFRGAYESNIEKPDRTFGKDRMFKSFPINDISQVNLITPKGELNLDRGENGWSVRERNGYLADPKKVGELLRSVFDLGIVQEVPVGESKLGRVGLLSPIKEADTDETNGEGTMASILRFQKGDESVGELWVGKEYQKTENGQFGPVETTVGRFVKRGDTAAVYVVDENFDTAKPEAEEWLNDQFFKVSKVKTIERIPAEKPEEAWKLIREGDKADFTLVDSKEGEEIDSTKVSSMKSAFANPSFEDVMVEEGIEKPASVVFNIETFEGFTYQVSLNEKNEENEYLLMVDVSGDFAKERKEEEEESDEDKEAKEKEFQENLAKQKGKLATEKSLVGHIFKVRGFVADSINKDRSELMKEPEEETADGAENPGPSIPGLEGMIPGLGN